MESTVREAVASFGPDESDVTRDATFESLEVDSLDLAELSQIVEEKFGVTLKGGTMERKVTLSGPWFLRNGLASRCPLHWASAALVPTQ